MLFDFLNQFKKQWKNTKQGLQQLVLDNDFQSSCPEEFLVRKQNLLLPPWCVSVRSNKYISFETMVNLFFFFSFKSSLKLALLHPCLLCGSLLLHCLC